MRKFNISEDLLKGKNFNRSNEKSLLASIFKNDKDGVNKFLDENKNVVTKKHVELINQMIQKKLPIDNSIITRIKNDFNKQKQNKI